MGGPLGLVGIGRMNNTQRKERTKTPWNDAKKIPRARPKPISPTRLTEMEADLCQDPRILQAHRLDLIQECRRLRARVLQANAERKVLERALRQSNRGA